MSFGGSNTLKWYTPAESWQPWSALLGSMLGSSGKQLEAEINNQAGTQHCVLAADAKSLMTLLLASLHEQDTAKRDLVLIPAYTCYTVAAAIVRAGLRIRVYDIKPANLHADLDSLQQALDKDVLAVISQHLFGIPTPAALIGQLAQQAGCWHIEDAAQAYGSVIDGRMAGSSGDFGLYSFGRGKALPVGGGGALVSNHAINIDTSSLIPGSSTRAMIMSVATRLASTPWLYGIAERLPLGLGETCFDPDFNTAGISSFHRKLCVSTLNRLETLRQHRHDISSVYQDALGKDTMSIENGTVCNITRYPLLACEHDLTSRLLQLGVRRMYPKAIVDEDRIKPHLDASPACFDGSREIAQRLVTLPTHRGINRQLAASISKQLRAWMH